MYLDLSTFDKIFYILVFIKEQYKWNAGKIILF